MTYIMFKQDEVDGAIVTVPSVKLRDPNVEQMQDALLALWSEIQRPSQFGVRLFTDDHEYSFTATPVTRIGNMLSIGLTTIGNPRVFTVEMSPLTAMYGSVEQIRNRLRAFALAAIDMVDMPVDAEDLVTDAEIDVLIDEFMGST